MKGRYMDVKHQLGNCMLHDSDDADSADSLSPASISELNHNEHNHSNNNNNNNSQSFAQTCTYDSLEQPFKADKLRGHWSMTIDFYTACTSYAFGSIMFSEWPVYALLFGGVYFLPAYLIAIILYAIPIFIIQTFLGQFSTSGTISALRVAPVFKGIGYSILVLNLSSLTYYVVIAAVPLIYAVNSLHSVIPWMSCDNAWNTPNCSTHSTYNENDYFIYPHATVEFFRSVIGATKDSTFAMLWPVLFATWGIWLLTLCIVLQRVSFIGKFFRCTYLLLGSSFLAIVALLLLEGELSWKLLFSYFEPTVVDSFPAIISVIPTAFFMATWMLGPGWGNILTLASHNHFHRDSEKLTYWVCTTHVLVFLIAVICGRMVLDHFEDHVGLFHFHVEEEHFMQFLYICFAYFFGSLSSSAQFWSFLFFIMLFIAELSAVIIQMMSVLTAIFDEYENLRPRRRSITIGVVVIMMLTSTYFCGNQGFAHLHILPAITILTHILISICLLWMATWIYGRERFQCDLQYMLGKTISNFKIFLIRFITPVILIISIYPIIFLIDESEKPSDFSIVTQCVVYLISPAYMIYKLCQTTGSLRDRLRQCFKPHDWYPVDVDNRRFYDRLMGYSEMLVIESEQQLANSP